MNVETSVEKHGKTKILDNSFLMRVKWKVSGTFVLIIKLHQNMLKECIPETNVSKK